MEHYCTCDLDLLIGELTPDFTRSGVCRSCAIKKLVMSRKQCWIQITPACSGGTFQIDQLVPSEEKRRAVEAWKKGETLVLLQEDEEVVEQEPDPPPPEVVIKQEPLDEEERIKGNPELSAKIAEAKARLEGGGVEEEEEYCEGNPVSALPAVGAPTEEEEEYAEEGSKTATTEYIEGGGVTGVSVKQEVMVKQEQEEPLLDPGREYKLEPGLCTPTSSGYWSDDGGSKGPHFGKLAWDPSAPGQVSLCFT